MRTGKKYVNVTDNDICVWKIKFKAKIELMKRNRD